ncbi:MAG: polysaccharide export protein EpsE [Moraxellaceae bacterium]|nr:MAG: polysaccharide export protein EpsE [Moraxellaceae bacterium]
MLNYVSKLCFLLLAVTSFTANAQLKYTLGSGDEIRITVYGQPELSTEGQINSEGMMTLPLLGNVQLGGRSSSEAAKLIGDSYEQGNYLKRPQVNLFVIKYRSQSVAILGKVNRPGKLILEGPTSLTEALAWAGGVSDEGNERLILIRAAANGKQERQEIDLQKALNIEADQNSIIWLRNGDTIYVPISGRFYLSGEVHSPGMYPLDRPLNVMQALGVGGGPNARANERSVKLFRKQPDGSVKEIRANPEDQIRDGDLLVVQQSLF